MSLGVQGQGRTRRPRNSADTGHAREGPFSYHFTRFRRWLCTVPVQEHPVARVQWQPGGCKRELHRTFWKAVCSLTRCHAPTAIRRRDLKGEAGPELQLEPGSLPHSRERAACVSLRQEMIDMAVPRLEKVSFYSRAVYGIS